jgi:hypothetical protein
LKKNSVISIIIFLLLNISFLSGQYVRQEKFFTEKERRNKYALDDWISYLESKHIVSIAVGNDYLYFATLDGGILRYEMFQNFWDYPYTTSNGLPSNTVFEVAYDLNNNILWAVTDVDTCIFKPAEQEWLCQSEGSLWPFEYPQQTIPPNSQTIEQNIFYPSQYLNLLPHFFANDNYTVISDWKIMDEYFDEYPVTGFLRDRWERIWLVIDGLGVGVGNPFSGRMDVIPIGLTHISPRVIKYQNSDLWIGGEPLAGTGRPGIVHWQDSNGGWSFYQARWISSLPSDKVRDIEVSGDSLWFATELGLSLFNSRTNEWKNFDQRQGLYSREILDLLKHNHLLYIATDKGINTLDLLSGIVKRIKDENIILADVYQMAAQRDTIWAVTNRGIFRQRIESSGWEGVIPTAAISDMPVTAVQTYLDEVWFCSTGGVFWYDGKSKRWDSFPQLGIEMQGPYFDIAVNNKSVWVSTALGMLKYNREMLFWKIFTPNDGLLSIPCYRLFLDGDYLWIANHFGITQFYWNNPQRID